MGFLVGSGAEWYRLGHRQKKSGSEWSYGPHTRALDAPALASGARAGHEGERRTAPATRDIRKTKISHAAAIALRAKTNTNGATGKRNKKCRASHQKEKESL